eukprot:707516-Rhodomonas_salina.1
MCIRDRGEWGKRRRGGMGTMCTVRGPRHSEALKHLSWTPCHGCGWAALAAVLGDALNATEELEHAGR